MPADKTEDAREAAKHKAEHMVTRLADELDKMLKMASWMREALYNELFAGMGYKQQSVADKDLKRMKELSAVWDTITSAKIRFDKASKALADNMTPEEERAAVVAYLKAATPKDRSDIISTVRQWQERRHGDSDSSS